jgi:hypothetical protein
MLSCLSSENRGSPREKGHFPPHSRLAWVAKRMSTILLIAEQMSSFSHHKDSSCTNRAGVDHSVGGLSFSSLCRQAAALSVGREASVSRCVRLAWSPSIAAPNARINIGQRIKKYVSNVPRSYATRRYSRTHRPRRTVPSAFYQCHTN